MRERDRQTYRQTRREIQRVTERERDTHRVRREGDREHMHIQHTHERTHARPPPPPPPHPHTHTLVHATRVISCSKPPKFQRIRRLENREEKRRCISTRLHGLNVEEMSLLCCRRNSASLLFLFGSVHFTKAQLVCL